MRLLFVVTHWSKTVLVKGDNIKRDRVIFLPKE